MQLDIRGKNVKVSEERRQLIEKKLGKLDRYLDSLGEATVELAAEHARKGGEGRLVVEMTVRTPAHGSLLRAEERDNDLGVALDRLSEKMQRQITRFKDRMVHHKGRPRVSEVAAQLQEAAEAKEVEIAPDVDTDAEEVLHLVKIKNFQVTAMYVDEAVEQMELLGHNFFIFQDTETEKISVAYLRNDGGYGLLRPELG
ncbi:MAG: ribosome-associated translation inhibitor RaiA [Chloroflexota bacterium]|nr:ribosome-associated translation inhibitor RaiA [Chloroflexota bacterium]